MGHKRLLAFFLFLCMAKLAVATTIMAMFNVRKPELKAAIELKLLEFKDQGMIKKFIFDLKSPQLLVLMEDTQLSNFDCLRESGVYFEGQDNDHGAYYTHERRINREQELASFVAMKLTFASEKKALDFIHRITKSHQFDDCIPFNDAYFKAQVYAFLPRDLEKISLPKAIHYEELASPGDESFSRFFKIEKEQDLNKAKIKFESIIDKYKVNDLLKMVIHLKDACYGSDRRMPSLPKILTDIIVAKLINLSPARKKTVLFKALDDLRNEVLPIKDAEYCLSIMQSILLHERISDLASKNILLKDQEGNEPRAFSDEAIYKKLKSIQQKEIGPKLRFQFGATLRTRTLNNSPWTYFVFKLKGNHHASAVLAKEDEEHVDIILFDPLNMQDERLEMYPYLKTFFQHIEKSLDKIFPDKPKSFFSFDIYRQKDHFNCGLFTILDYQTVSQNLPYFEKLLSSQKKNPHITALKVIPPAMIRTAQSIEGATPELDFLYELQAVRYIQPRVSERGNAYVFMEHISLFKETIKQQVSFSLGGEREEAQTYEPIRKRLRSFKQ